jgi:hypothetical protein
MHLSIGLHDPGEVAAARLDGSHDVDPAAVCKQLPLDAGERSVQFYSERRFTAAGGLDEVAHIGNLSSGVAGWARKDQMCHERAGSWEAS